MAQFRRDAQMKINRRDAFSLRGCQFRAECRIIRLYRYAFVIYIFFLMADFAISRMLGNRIG